MTQVVDKFEFKLTVPMEKSESDGRWLIKGIAAGAGVVDKDGDELMPQAIEHLAAQINSVPVPFRNHHQNDSITEDLGEVVKASVTPDWQLEVEVELDQDNPDSQYLWKKLGQGKKFGLSIRGNSENPVIEKAGGFYKSKHHTISLTEISATTRPYFTHSLGTVLRKAIDEAMSSLATIGENTIMADSNTGETPVVQESSAPENDTAATEVSPSEQLVKSLMDDAGFVELIKSTVNQAVQDALPKTEETSEEDNTEIAKAEAETTEEAPNVAEIVKSAVEEVSKQFTAQIEALANKIPDAPEPALLIKSEEENVHEALAGMSPSDRLRAGLAARHDQLDKLR